MKKAMNHLCIKASKNGECTVKEQSICVMDFPTAWKFIADTKLKDHDEKCSYRVENRCLLCDCNILGDEYEKRKGKTK